MTQDMVKMMSQDKMIGKWEILSSSPSPWFSRFLRTVLLLLMMTQGVSEMSGQTIDYSGTYYIANNDKSNYKGYDNAENFYLCPAWEYFVEEGPTTTSESNGKPFLTTNQTTQAENALWIVEKITVGNETYYTFKQKDGENSFKYLTVNDALKYYDNNVLKDYGKPHRKRVHLEERTPATLTDKNYFNIEDVTAASGIKGYSISYYKTPTGTKNKYLNPAGGNHPSYSPTELNNETPKTSGGMVGFYTEGSTSGEGMGSVWFFEVPKPVIHIDEDNKLTFSCVNEDVTFHYTINGEDPSATDSNIYDEDAENVLEEGHHTIKVMAVMKSGNTGYASGIVTQEVTIISTNSSYLIRSKESPFYYLIPNLKMGETDYPKNLTTLNVPCSTMVWNFEDAADNDGRYYYIHNSQGGYLYYTTSDNSNNYVYFNSTKDTDDDGYKFSITPHASGGFNIIPKGQTTPINKPSIAANNDGDRLSPVKLTGAVGDITSRWTLIPYTGTASLPQWTDVPFMESTDDVTHYYKIVSNIQTTKPLILDNSGDVKSETVPTTNYDVRKAMWVIKKVDSDTDGLLDYYTFKNAYTGELLYYNGKGRGIKDSAPVLQMGMPSTEGADATWSHFVVVQTVSGYNIIPRAIVDNTKSISRVGTGDYTDGKGFNCINRASGNDSPGTWYDNDGGSRWTFEEQTNVTCMEPVFTEEANGDITITTVTNAAKILYTINDVNNPDASSTEYTTKENTSVKKVIKAIAIIGDDASTASNVVTLLNKPDITLAAGPYTYKGTAWEPAITKVSITLSGTEIEADASAYSVTSASYTNNINAGTDAATVTLSDADATDLWCILNASTNFSIDKAPLTITPTAGQSKVYGDDDPTLEYSSSIATTSGLYGTDAFGGVLGRVVGENVGSYPINQGTLSIKRESTDVSANYDITFADESFTVTKRPITISGIAASEKTYDGNTAATLVYTGVTYGNIKDGDVLNVTATGTFDNKNAGTGKAVTISGLTLGGDDVSNYELATSGQQDEATADINPKPLTITNIGLTASGKTYDGTTAANFIDYSNATIDGIIVGDDLTIDSATGTFDDKNVCTGKTVTITGFTFGGTDAANYTYNGGDLTATADITPALVTVTAEDKTKGYGDADPELTWTVAGLQGTDTKDVLTVSISRIGGEDVNEDGYIITPSGDNDQGNYTVTSYTTGKLTITPKAIGNGTTPAEGIDIDISYDGTDYTVTVKQGENELQQGEDKAYTWTGADGSTDTYVVTITGQGNYNNSAKATYIKQTFYDTTPDQVLTTETTAAVYCATQNLKVNDTFEAYYVTKLENNSLTITKVEAGEGENKKNYIPEGQPVLLISETNPAPKGFTLKPYTGTGTDLVTIPETGEGANLLKVVTDDGGKAVNLEEVYIFSMGEFVLNKAGTMSKGKFYLENPDYNTSSHSRSFLSITSGDVTGINTSQLSDTDSQIPDIWYTIGGQKLHKKPTRKGIYLQNGKKVVIK